MDAFAQLEQQQCPSQNLLKSTPLEEKKKEVSAEDEDEEINHLECKQLLQSLPKERGWRTNHLYLYQSFWCQPKEIQAIISFQHHFKPQDTDILIASIPKTGTTWLKALAFAIVNRNLFDISNNHPLLTINPHNLIPFFEYKLYADNQFPDLSTFPAPRLFATHIPFSSLPESMIKSDSRIVYICRNPFDTFVSIWHFLKPKAIRPFSLEEAFDMYCRGVVGFGPYWNHMLGYWKESLKTPQKVLFLKYEDMKEDINFELKKLAEFLGFTFSLEEEKDGIVGEIAKLCSLEKLKDLKVNRHGTSILGFEIKACLEKE